MKSSVLLLIISSVFAQNNERPSSQTFLSRSRRGAVGALDIVTNHAQPLHADVKPEISTDNAEKVLTEKVTPPEDAVTTYEVKSLRKSLPHTPPVAVTLIRSISRVVTIIMLFASAVVEFYPTLYDLICTIHSFMNTK